MCKESEDTGGGRRPRALMLVSEGCGPESPRRQSWGFGRRDADGAGAPVQAGWAVARGVHAERAAGRQPPGRTAAETSSRSRVA